MKKSAVLVMMLLGAGVAVAQVNSSQHLGSRGQSKVNSAEARGWMQQNSSSGYQVQQQQSQVNIGSKKAGTCTMNVGGTQGRGSKDVVVTAKDIINVCK
ncbi:MAG: hypothetical protein RIR00_237 [Pseudomonadota bacterium]|jgi:TolA-binding protein